MPKNSGKKAPPQKQRSRFLFRKIGFYKHLQKLVAVNMTDKTSRVVKRGDVCRVLGKDIANELIYRIVTLLFQRVVNGHKDFLHLVFPVLVNRKCHRFVQHIIIPFRILFFLHNYYTLFFGKKQPHLLNINPPLLKISDYNKFFLCSLAIFHKKRCVKSTDL